MRAHLVLRAVRPGITLGPLPASAGTAAWLSIVATGLVDGVVETPSGTVRLRGWYGAHAHEWATYRHHWTQAYVRRDLALLWRSPRDIRLVWGLSPSAGRPRRTSRTTRSGAGSAPGWARDRPCAQPTFAAEA